MNMNIEYARNTKAEVPSSTKRAQEVIAIASYAGTLQIFFIGNSSFQLLERGKQEKKSPLPYSICSYTQMTVTKSGQWIAGSLALVYWDLMPVKGSLYACFNYDVSLKRITDYADFLQCLSLLPSLQLRYLNSVFLTTKRK